ncbi:SMI1/KNR4 family protein [Macrococcoides canis]|uniref:SMI1/KNR4 family protein n=1 Tax=Macrococcoides canis TaxID=1855823 RepID=UPI0020B67274|nr:SMI1/KNR4 family protein [Macrococcus canis]UTH01511.1 SMI1/KNR4 family protein [Macrococcus canis]
MINNNMDDYLEIRGEKINKNNIESFEEWRGYKLPNDFIEFTLKYPGAYMEASFDAEGRPAALVNVFLKFDESESDSMYIESLYEFTDFGPYVLFGFDAGGNYLAFDYSIDKQNPSIVFIDHEEFGEFELPEGTTESDFTENEIDKMLSSERLEDFPWAIHFVAESFTKFLEMADFKIVNNKYVKPDFETKESDISEIEKYFNVELPNKYKVFILKYGGYEFLKSSFEINNLLFEIKLIYSLSKMESLNLKYMYEKKGGKEKFKKLVPIILVGQNNNIRDFSVLAFDFENLSEPSIILIPQDMFYYEEKIDRDKLIFITDDVDMFFDNLSDELGDFE